MRAGLRAGQAKRREWGRRYHDKSNRENSEIQTRKPNKG
jgi:hypothetical protein